MGGAPVAFLLSIMPEVGGFLKGGAWAMCRRPVSVMERAWVVCPRASFSRKRPDEALKQVR